MSATLPTHGLDDEADRTLIREALDETLVVEAAAGTGKTTELVARIVRLIAGGLATIDQIVAVTFTEKAAGELKLRIREELEQARMAPAGGTGTGTGACPLDEALAHLEEAHVSTIHGFCADLLRERPVEARVDPGFEVLTEPQAERVFDRAFRAWFQQQLEDPSDGVRRALRRQPSAWSPYADDEDGPVERLRRAAKELLQWRDLRAPWRREPFDRDAEVRTCAGQLCAFADLTAHPSWDQDPLFQTTEGTRSLAAELRRSSEGDGDTDLDGWEAALIRLGAAREFKEIGTRRTGRKPDYGTGVTRQQVLEAHAALDASLAAFARRADADLAALLQQDLLGCVDLYDDLKTRAGALDFLDLLLRARALVRECAPVRHAFQDRFKYILVDEFQDTDPLQAEILLLLAGDEAGSRLPDSGSTPGHAAAAGEGQATGARTPEPDWRKIAIRKGALFVVGDPKQSIYRFRRADVGIYQEVCDLLVERQGARRVHLRTNFRSVPDIQHAVNAAFAPAMTLDRMSLQADYVPLAPHRDGVILKSGEPASVSASDTAVEAEQAGREPGATSPGPTSRRDAVQPSIIVLPVPDPYGKRNLAMPAIEASLPDAVGAWVAWLLEKSGWMITERREGRSELVSIQARHVCVLFRRFVKFRDDMTRPYVDALEARGIPHLLVGGRSFHEREEVETLRAALAAIEWPEDAMSVYATLRGALFALGEESLLEYWHRHPRHRFHPFDVPENLPAHLEAVGEALAFLRKLHAGRNHRPAADTLGRLLEHTRAHVAFVMRPAGERVLANVLQVVELARQYEADGGISFRGFVDALRAAAERSEAAEAPVVEEGSDGVRLMTVHKAKGLEFPVVILADLTCKLRRNDASRHIDQARGLCAMPLVGCTPYDLVDHEAEELARESAEGVRLTYVAATRARDVLVVPAIGDGPYDGWLGTLNSAIYPVAAQRQDAQPAPGCPAFPKDTLRTRPDDNPGMRADTVRAGLHVMSYVAPSSPRVGQGFSPADPEHVGQGFSPADPEHVGQGFSPASDAASVPAPRLATYPVVWWSPGALSLDVRPPFGLRREDLISKDVVSSVVAESRTAYDTWSLDRATAIANGTAPSLHVRTMTELAHSGDWPAGVAELPRVEVIELPRPGTRPTGRRFGTLVHAVLATTPLAADAAMLTALARLEGRILGAPEAEVSAAADLAARVLAQPLIGAARAADAVGKCRREVPVTLHLHDGRLLEGIVDLAFEHDGAWAVIDFKTDEDPSRELDAYRRQVSLYAVAIAQAVSAPVSGAVLIA